MPTIVIAKLAAPLAGLAALAVAVVSQPSPATADEGEEGLTVLHLTQTAERALKRDRLRAQLRVEVTGGDARRVQADINRMMGAALERAKAVAGIKVETSGYAVYEDSQSNVPTRWHGSQGLSLVGADFAAVLALSGDLQAAGLVTSGMGFELAPETARGAEDELTSEALARLRQRAERVAGDLQLTLLRLRDIKIGNVDAERPPRPVMVMRSVAIGGVASAPPPAAEAGDATVQVSVEAEIVLGPSDHSQP